MPRFLCLWSTTTLQGAQILYPSITVHAQDKDAVLLELNLSDSNSTADDDIESIQLRIIPANHPSSTNHVNGNHDTDAAYALYKAIGECQELNPDPARGSVADYHDDDMEDETAPGATGWITSENMQDCVDDDGNFRVPPHTDVVNGDDHAGDEVSYNDADSHTDDLGPGSSRTRTASEADIENGAEPDEAKWQRTG